MSTNTTHEIITLDLADDTIHFTAIIDTSSTLTQGTVGPVQPVQLPAQVSGWLVGDSLTISNDSIAQKCDPVISALSADLHSLLIGFPIQLSQGNNWRDSVELRTCQAMILTTARIARSYVVSGEIIYQGSPAVVVQRRDLIHAHGEGAQQQHRLVLDVSGTGNATYYLSPQNGVILCLSTGQDLDLAITTSGKIYRFKQSSKQDFSSVR